MQVSNVDACILVISPFILAVKQCIAEKCIRIQSRVFVLCMCVFHGRQLSIHFFYLGFRAVYLDSVHFAAHVTRLKLLIDPSARILLFLMYFIHAHENNAS